MCLRVRLSAPFIVAGQPSPTAALSFVELSQDMEPAAAKVDINENLTNTDIHGNKVENNKIHTMTVA